MPKSSPSPDALAAIEKAAALAAAVAEKNAQKGNDDDDEQKQANLDKKLAVAKEKARWGTRIISYKSYNAFGSYIIITTG